MNTLKSMHIEVWSNDGSQMLSFRGESDSKPGLGYIWFVMFRREFESLVEGRISMAQDGNHKLDTMGACWTFLYMPVPSKSHGEMTVPYLRVEIPLFIQQLILRKAIHIWESQKGIKGQTVKVIIELSQETRDRWVRKYGQGKGKVRWNIHKNLLARVEEHKSDEGFRNMLNRINQIALNRTEGWFDTAEVRLIKDLDGYWWSAINPKGQQVMNGTLVNHGARKGKFDWSLHT